MHSPRFAFSSFLTLILLSTTGFAQQPATHVPPDLEPWRQWVLQGEEFRNCPFYANRGAGEESNHLCAWPGVLSLSLNQGNGSFEQTWTVHEAGWVALPGDQKNWPEAVSVDGRPAAVVSKITRAMTPPKAPIQNMSPASPRGMGPANSPCGLMVSNRRNLTMAQAKNGPAATAARTTIPSAMASTPLTWSTLAPRLRSRPASSAWLRPRVPVISARKYSTTTTTRER
ncbi:MAG: hypothetical protein IIA98_00920 [Proteobacteria bacterium]|nr:hypothetical protein [Pseudomonadota bacterium]